MLRTEPRPREDGGERGAAMLTRAWIRVPARVPPVVGELPATLERARPWTVDRAMVALRRSRAQGAAHLAAERDLAVDAGFQSHAALLFFMSSRRRRNGIPAP